MPLETANPWSVSARTPATRSGSLDSASGSGPGVPVGWQPAIPAIPLAEMKTVRRDTRSIRAHAGRPGRPAGSPQGLATALDDLREECCEVRRRGLKVALLSSRPHRRGPQAGRRPGAGPRSPTGQPGSRTPTAGRSVEWKSGTGPRRSSMPCQKSTTRGHRLHQLASSSFTTIRKESSGWYEIMTGSRLSVRWFKPPSPGSAEDGNLIYYFTKLKSGRIYSANSFNGQVRVCVRDVGLRCLRLGSC